MASWQTTEKSVYSKTKEKRLSYLIGQPFLRARKKAEMRNYNEEIALKIILQAAKEYDVRLKNKQFLIVYRGKQGVEKHCVGFRERNFLHLTGVKTNMSAKTFYSACINGRLSLKDISVDRKGKVQQKLQVLPYLSGLLYHNCMIGDFINSGISIKADYFVGDTRAVLSVGFRDVGEVDIPVTLYNESVKKLSDPTCKVLAIFRKEYDDPQFDICTYITSGYEIDRFPKEIRERIDDRVRFLSNKEALTEVKVEKKVERVSIHL